MGINGTMNNKKHLVIGLGEVGLALVKVFKCDGEDKFKDIEATEKSYKFLHIAFPYKDETFIEEVKKYQDKYSPTYTIIHSTVPIGTSIKCNALHSPVRGVHPHLADSILTFKKFLGGDECFEVAQEFKKFRINCLCTRDSRNTEAMKLWDTSQYGVMIMLNKEIHKYCMKNNLDFNIVYSLANETYNEGYTKMLRPEVMRPYLAYVDEPLKGHCILENAILLRDGVKDKKIIDRILAMGKHISTISEEKPYMNKSWFYCEHIGKKRTLKDIGEEFGVTGENIGTIARRHGWMIRDRKWTEEELDMLLEKSGEMTFAELTKLLVDKTHDAIRSKAIKLGIKSPYSPGEETKKEETRKKISATLQGITLEEWNGFIENENNLIRKSDEYAKWREGVFKRDNFTCVKCGSKDELNADHIKCFALYPELRLEIDNGQTLCVKCHKEKTKEDWKIIREAKNINGSI